MNEKLKKRIEIQKKAVKEIASSNFRGIVDVAPRVGKSKIGIDAMKELKKNKNKKVLITAPFNPILESWQGEFRKWEFDFHGDIINQRSLDKVNMSDYALIISDEIHTLSEYQRHLLKGKKVLGFSGSISKKTKKILEEELFIRPIYTYTIAQAIKDKIISDYQIKVISCNLDTKQKYIEVNTKKSKFKTTEWNNYQYLDSQFNKFKAMAWSNPRLNNVKMQMASKRADFIYNSRTKLEACKRLVESMDERCLVFTARTNVADSFGINSYHSKSTTDTLSMLCNKDIDKLAVCEMTSMGVTVPDLKVGILHQLKSSEENAIQKILRMCNWEDGEIAKIYIFQYANTQDEVWVNKALEPFDQSKIDYISLNKFEYA
jgi:superfamily II DNA or RNA helicase